MKTKTSYLFGEKTSYKQGLKKFKGSESIFELFSQYYLQLDLLKYKLFGEDFENYGQIMIRGEPHSPTKINLDILEKYLSKMKLFQKIFASNNEQEKKVKVESSKDDLKDFLEMLKKNKISALNYFKIRRVPKFKIKKVSINEKAKSVNYNYYKYRNNDNTINNNSINKKDNTKNSSIEKTLNKTPLHLNKIRKININKKQYLLSPISSSPLSCRQLVKKKLIKENSLIKGFNSFNCPYEKKCIQKKLYISNR